ncbi:mRNA decay activator protein ZFP36L3-like [Dromaius novaehollandiae]|uniref:mRNA decay activator protein ZFP36L3-like n=1 Tax=Dromaius novaehollandiae TaxID=8790 RepID=UPI00311DE3A3
MAAAAAAGPSRGGPGAAGAGPGAAGAGPWAGPSRLPPPAAALALALLALGAAFAALGRHVAARRDLPDPEAAQAWHALFSALARFPFCGANGSAAPPPGPALAVWAGLTFDLPPGPRPNGTRLRLALPGPRLGLGGPPATGLLQAVAHVGGPGPTCLGLTGPPELLPHTSTPPRCTPDPRAEDAAGACYQPRYRPEPALDPPLSPEERGLAAHRLLLAGAVLLGLGALVGVAALRPPARRRL